MPVFGVVAAPADHGPPAISSSCRFGVKTMFKPPVFLTFWSVLLLASAGPEAVGAEPIAELRAGAVIEPARQDKPDDAPVVSPSGEVLAAAGDDHLVRIVSLSDGTVTRRLAGHTDWVRCVLFSPDGQMLATSGNDRRIMLWDMSTRQPPRTLPHTPQAIYAMAFSRDGGMLAAAGFEAKVRVYDVHSGRLLQVLDAPGRDIRAVAFSPEGKQMVAAGREGRIRIWEVSSGAKIRDIDGGGRICAVAYSPDGTCLASAGNRRDVRLWNPQTGELLQTLPPQPGEVLSLAFCGPGRLAAGGTDNVIRLWEIAARAETHRLVGHTGSVTTLAWEPEAGVLISGSFDTTVRVWRLPAGGGDKISRVERSASTAN